MEIIKKPTTNYAIGRSGNLKPELIVIHIMEGSLIGTDAHFANVISGVSSHYGIGKLGEVHQYVEEKDTAWHAGIVDRPTFKLYKVGVNPNAYSIGIEHEGNPVVNDVWSIEMKNRSAEMIAGICSRWNIPIDRDHIIGHYEIRASKPDCPAINKSIIDELISLAINVGQVQTESKEEKMTRAMALLAEALAIIKSIK